MTPQGARPRLDTSPAARPTGAILAKVLRIVAALTLAAFTLLVCVDKVCCPDGCTDKTGTAQASTESAPHSVTHTCVLCVGVESPDVQLSLEPLADVSIVPAVRIAWLPVRNPRPPEHPPRNA